MMEGPSFDAARLEDLPELLSFVDHECARGGVPQDAAFALRLAAEEAFVNIVRHAYTGGAGPVRSSLTRDDQGITITFTDEAPPFDPRDVPPPDLDAELADRREGGLGLHLIRQLMDEVHYRYRAGAGNTLELVKYLGESQ
jgi:serine/threonine-protein kinase RsbW